MGTNSTRIEVGLRQPADLTITANRSYWSPSGVQSVTADRWSGLALRVCMVRRMGVRPRVWPRHR